MQSMTGFAAVSGTCGDRQWGWEAKSVNARGLDLKFRIGDTPEADEAVLRPLTAKSLKRGSVTVFLKETSKTEAGALALNEVALATVIDAAAKGEAAASDAGLTLSTPSVAELLAIRGVLEPASSATVDEDALKSALRETFSELVKTLAASRAEEGGRLKATISAQIDEIARLTAAAADAFDLQSDALPARLADKAAQVMQAGEVDPDRLAQELALIAVKGDVREELDRLETHIAAARDLIEESGPIGRKLDFLTQEFNREANTLCSKSGSAALTQIGLDLKVVIDQLREQAANVE